MFKFCGVLILIVTFCSYAHAKCDRREPLGLLDETSLIRDLANLSSEKMSGRKTGSNGSFKARNFLQTRFTEIGLMNFSEHSEYIQTFSFPYPSSNKQGANIIGWLKGAKFPNKFIVVTAHYDHLGTKGTKVYYGAGFLEE